MLGKIGALAVTASLVLTSTAFAAGSTNEGALSKGGAAGVKQAESFSNHQLLWLVGGGLVIGGIVLVATGNGHGSVGPTCPLDGCTPPPTPPVTTTTTTTTTAP